MTDCELWKRLRIKLQRFSSAQVDSQVVKTSRMINGNSMHLSSISSVIAKGLNTYVNKATLCWSCLKTSTTAVSWTDSSASLLDPSTEWRLSSAHKSDTSHRLPQVSPTKAPHTRPGKTVKWP